MEDDPASMEAVVAGMRFSIERLRRKEVPLPAEETRAFVHLVDEIQKNASGVVDAARLAERAWDDDQAWPAVRREKQRWANRRRVILKAGLRVAAGEEQQLPDKWLCELEVTLWRALSLHLSG